VRLAVPSYAQDMSTLAELLDEVYKLAGGRTRKRAAKVRFSEFCNEAHDRAFARSKSLLTSAVTVARVSPKDVACPFTGIGQLAPGRKSFMGDRCCALSASTSFFPVDAWEWYADSSSCIRNFVLVRHRLATSRTLSRGSRTGLMASPARTES
jgi:hypothetical protein